MKTTSTSFKVKALLLSFILIILGVLKSNAQTYTVTSLGDGGTAWLSTCSNGTAFNAGTLTEGIRRLNMGLATKIVFSVTGTIDLSARSSEPLRVCVNNVSIQGSAGVIIYSSLSWQDLIKIEGNNDTIKNLDVRGQVEITGGGNYVSGCNFNTTMASRDGLYLSSGASNNKIISNTFLGVTGTTTGVGVRISGATTINNSIQGNTISAYINGVSLESTGSNTILSNTIFGNISTNASSSNEGNGILVTGSSNITLNGNIIYSNTANVANSSGGNGILITSSSSSIKIINNKVGTDATGNIAKGNNHHGIKIEGGSGHKIGMRNAGNQVVANGNAGPTAIDIDHGFGEGIFLSSVTNSSIKGNKVGVNALGTSTVGSDSKALGNHLDGIYLEFVCSSDSVGGILSGEENISGGNGFAHELYSPATFTYPQRSGIYLISNSGNNTGNIVIGNYCGTNASGDNLGNRQEGITLNGTVVTLNTIKGNICCYNSNGIASRWGTNNNTIINNYVGTLTDGTSSHGNTNAGISLENGAIRHNVYGNTIAHNGGHGVSIIGSGANATKENNIGGLTAGQGNTISYNGINGVDVFGTVNLRNTIRGNSISCNTGMGINLNYGANQGNGGLASPVISSSLTTANHVEGTSVANAIIDLYYVPTTCPRLCDNALKQEGLTYVASVTANASGAWQYNTAMTGTVTATANSGFTNGYYNTSEFATCSVLCIAPTPTQGGNKSICTPATSTSMSATAPSGVGESGSWSFVSGPNTPTITTPSSATTTVTGLIVGIYKLRWTVTNGTCSAFADATITVNQSPTVTSSATGTICSGAAQNYTITADVAGATFSWSRATVTNITEAGVAGQTANPITETLTNTTSSAIVVRYVITPTANTCAGTAFNYDVTVNPKPIVTSSTTGAICSGTAQNYTITSGVAGATFSWSRATVTNITEAGVAGQTANPITESLTNTTTSAIVVRYVITPTANTCAGTAINYDVTVNPKPVVTSSTTGAICSGTAQNYTITSGVAGATFSWSRATVTNITEAGVAGQTANPITETLTNTTASAIVVRYVITPTAGICAGTAFNYDVTVNTQPTVTSSASGAICSGIAQSYTITADISGTTFSWSRATVTNITEPGVAGQTANPITETLTNTTSSAIVVRYVIIPTANTCAGSGTPFNYDVTVNPKPMVTSNPADAICSEAGQSYTITADIGGTDFNWSRATVTNITEAGVTGQTANPITETLTNTTTSAIVVRYVITPTANTCSGTAFNYDVTVNPKPVVSSSATGTICSGTAQNYTITSGVIGTTFSWDRATVADITEAGVTGQTANPITEVLTNTSAAGIQVRYVITPTAGTCTGTVFNYDVMVNPKPTISSSNNGNVCSGVAQNYLITSDLAGTTFSWSRATVGNINEAGVSNQTANPITEILTDNSSSSTDVHYLITPTLGTCAGIALDYTVSVNPNPTLSASADNSAICSGGFTNLNASATGGDGSYTFTWSPGATLSATTGPTVIATPTGNTTYTVVVADGNGCGDLNGAIQIPVTISPDVTAAFAGSDKTICGDAIQLHSKNVTVGTGTWSSVSGTVTFDNANDSLTTAHTLSSGVNQLIWTVDGTCGGPSKDTVEISIGASSLMVDLHAAQDTMCVGSPADLQATVSGSNATPFSFVWTSTDGLNVVKTTSDNNSSITSTTSNTGWVYYTVNVVDANNCAASPAGLDSVYAVGQQALVVPNLITPNEDHHNDCLIIRDVNNFDILPGSVFDLYNRWGEAVYKNDHYKNGDFCGAQLADGVYYFYMQTSCDHREIKGWLHIIANEASNK